MTARIGEIKRDTTETQIELTLNLDGTGQRDLNIPVPFLRHMLDLFAKHGGFDLNLNAQGDIDIDDHHTVEDIGICLGQAFKQAVGDKAGIKRYGNRFTPMDEALAQVTLDISGRSYLVFNAEFPKEYVGTFNTELVEEFFHAFVGNAGVTLHINVHYGTNTHHMIEGVFKAFGGALSEAVYRDPNVRGVLSTKGVL
ncbi:imidazoleglycerol-phosphate dehydratase HisB [Tumebacillus sp. ITR2]|uniref:Imidazoleglycerol-phosphate dehydratase n=1 Tax=Tumebacillus amylolyticus TaxID=2801339 RepID=A0ABS1JA76_9BACL|nr:imidazoleglycerol-phosphate dehydratase HisB [Tumebacillus amylolyticus]MBL0386944.1 imidazoleglycerol-phosphate dehydratase HisB [Tumebacillus amylolyticus]